MVTASCLCGAVRFDISGTLASAEACHCTQCRKTSGHYTASASAKRTEITLHTPDAITWFQSSAKGKRGFCATCGSSLLWDPAEGDVMWVELGSIDGPTGVHLEKHAYVANKGDYYHITDGLPQDAQ